MSSGGGPKKFRMVGGRPKLVGVVVAGVLLIELLPVIKRLMVALPLKEA